MFLEGVSDVCVQGGASVHTRMCVCRCFHMDMGLGACLHLCVCLHQCVRCPWTQELWRDPIFGFLHRRDRALPQPLLQCLGAHGPLFSARWPVGASSLPSLPGHVGHRHGTMTGRSWNKDCGSQRGSASSSYQWGRRQPGAFPPPSLILSCPGAEAFCISQKPDSPQR